MSVLTTICLLNIRFLGSTMFDQLKHMSTFAGSLQNATKRHAYIIAYNLFSNKEFYLKMVPVKIRWILPRK